MSPINHDYLYVYLSRRVWHDQLLCKLENTWMSWNDISIKTILAGFVSGPPPFSVSCILSRGE